MNIDNISDLEDIFNKNIIRVSSLIDIYYLVKPDGKGKKKVTETDTLRAAVVFLHAALEDVMRGLAVIFWVKNKNPKILEKVPLYPCNPSHRNLKFTLGDLCTHSGKQVDEIIEESVRNYIYSQFTINDIAQLKAEITNLDFNNSFNFIKDLPKEQTKDITDFFERRHKIVHHADRNKSPRSPQSSNKAQTIKPETVQEWQQNITQIVKNLFEEARTKI